MITLKLQQWYSIGEYFDDRLTPCKRITYITKDSIKHITVSTALMKIIEKRVQWSYAFVPRGVE